jgi:hypothetical protein
MNLETGATGRYENFYFNSLANIGGKIYGIDTDGLHLLEGYNDGTDAIETCVALGRVGLSSDFLKMLVAIYTSSKSELPVVAVVRTANDTFIYEARSSGERITVQRIDTGKGLRETWFDIDLCNMGGSSFELGGASVSMAQSARRI